MKRRTQQRQGVEDSQEKKMWYWRMLQKVNKRGVKWFSPACFVVLVTRLGIIGVCFTDTLPKGLYLSGDVVYRAKMGVFGLLTGTRSIVLFCVFTHGKNVY